MENPKQGDYVVLLTDPQGIKREHSQIPVNYVYKLREDFAPYYFLIEKDLKGSKTNGYSNINPDIQKKYKLTVRLATDSEVQLYKENNGPVEAEDSNLEKILLNLDNHILKMEEQARKDPKKLAWYYHKWNN